MTPSRVAVITLLTAAVQAGCGAAPPRPEPTSAPEGAPPGPSWQDEADPIASRMREIDAQMRQAGLTAGAVHGRGFLAHRATETLPLELPAGRCWTIAAITTSGIDDLDAVLYAPSGDVLAEDIEPDAHPSIQVCGGPDGRRAYYHLQAYAGSGVYLFATFESEDRAGFEPAARILGGRPGVVAEDAQGAEQDSRLREHTSGLVRRGFRPVSPPEPVPLGLDQRVRVPLVVERGDCYSAAAFAGEGLSDVDLVVLDEAGGEIARDVGPTRDPAAQFCAEAGGDFAVELHAVSGRGAARLALYHAPGSVVGGTSGLWRGIRREQQTVALDLPGAVERDLATARRTGWAGGSRTADGVLARGEAVAHEVTLPGGRCTRLLVTGGPGIGWLWLRLIDGAGDDLVAPVAGAGSAAIGACPDRTTRAELQIVSRGGSGGYAVRSTSRAVPAYVPADATASDRSAIVQAAEDSVAEGYRVAEVTGFEGTATRVALPAQQGHCQRLDVVARGAARVDARLLRGDRVTSVGGGRVVTMSACGAATAELSTTSPAGAWVLRGERPIRRR